MSAGVPFLKKNEKKFEKKSILNFYFIFSADVSLNDSASTTQSNVTSECSEAECDREPLVKQSSGAGGNRGKLVTLVALF